MTKKEREKAIDLLDNLIGMIEDNQGNDYDFALKMGIEALKQESCGDAVSRQYIIEKFNEINGTAELDRLFEIVENAPSVTPTRKTGKWIDTGEISTNRRGQIVHEVICSECNGISYFRSMGNKYIGANLCPNCGSRNCQERLKGESNGSK